MIELNWCFQLIYITIYVYSTNSTKNYDESTQNTSECQKPKNFICLLVTVNITLYLYAKLNWFRLSLIMSYLTMSTVYTEMIDLS